MHFVKDWNECLNFSRQVDKKIFKNLSFSRNPPNILLKSLHKETRINPLIVSLTK